MKLNTLSVDKLSIGLSFLCLAHCLLLPVLLIALPSLTALNLEDEMFHKSMVFIVIPLSLFALLSGCKKHNRVLFLTLGITGIFFLTSALLLEDSIGEYGEKIFTLIGSVLMASAHFFNYKQCKKNECCDK